MKIAAAVVALTHATDYHHDMINCWPANENAPHCGCQMIRRDRNMINKKCVLNFDEEAVLGEDNIAMISVASSFTFPDTGSIDDSSLPDNRFVWTGFEGLSHENLHDIVWFFRPDVCPNFEIEQDYPVVNLTVFQNGGGLVFDECEDIDEQWLNDSLPLLGNFNYDIARSHQSYNLPIYGMESGQTALVSIESHHADWDLTENFVSVRNVTAHHGHGVDSDDTECDAEFTFTLNDHLGVLEYVNFYLCEDPTVSGAASPGDYFYNVPSSWTSSAQV